MEVFGYEENEKNDPGCDAGIGDRVVESITGNSADSTFLSDGIHIITRWLAEGKGLSPVPQYQYSDYRRVVKKRAITALTAKKVAVRRSAHKDLLMYAGKVKEHALKAIPELCNHRSVNMDDPIAGRILAKKIARAVAILGRAVDQANRPACTGQNNADSGNALTCREE